MLSIILKYYSMVFCNIYCFNKLLNIKSHSKYFYTIIHLISFFISLVIAFWRDNSVVNKSVYLFMFCYIFLAIFSNIKFSISFISFSLAFSITCMALTVSGFILSIFFTPFYKNGSSIPSILYVLSCAILQFVLIYCLFQNKRFKKGMPFLFKSSLINLKIFIYIFAIIYIIFIFKLHSSTYPFNLITLLFILFLAFLLLFWWRRRITLDYVQKLRMDEVESLYKKISDNEREIEKLNTNNDYLSKVIHKDNKLIPAMEMALHSYLLEAPSMEAEEARQFGADLLSQLQSMSAEREGIISNYQKNTDFHPKIGIYSVDAVILYMEKRAEKFNITYNLRFDNDIKDAIVGFIHERDMLHLLSDLIENAIIAVKDASHREIFLHIGFLQGGLFIDLYDSGIPFEPAVYQDFGNCQHTTHADSGGSGIGLMDIWNLKRKYKASLQIYEYLPDSDIYTKKIRLLFDRRNHFLLQTYRDKEIRSFITRSDLHVFPLKEMKKKDKE